MNNFNDTKIRSEMISLVDNKKLCSGIALAFGNEEICNYYNYGITGNNNFCVSSNTIIDLASVTKLFLCFAYFYLYDLENIDFDKTISFYSDSFKNIKNFSINDLMHFNCLLKTQNRISNISYEEALTEIINIEGKPLDLPLYSDMPAIVLGILFEHISQKSFGSFVNENIIKPFNLSNTFWNTNKKIDNFMDYSGEIQILNGQILKLNNPPLIVNDIKARILSNNGKNLCGHSGIFSCASDICKISQALLNGEVISKKSLNKIGHVINTNSNQRFGNLCYCKSPIDYLSEVPFEFSDNSFAMSGFTGNYYCIDPKNNRFIFIGSNKLSNRVSKFDDGVEVTDSMININSQKFICSKSFAFEKDTLRNACSKCLLRYIKD